MFRNNGFIIPRNCTCSCWTWNKVDKATAQQNNLLSNYIEYKSLCKFHLLFKFNKVCYNFIHLWYRYIFSLALADLLVIVICVPLASLIYTLDSWPWGSTLCRVTEFSKDTSIGVSVFTLTALSAERYIAITHPLRKLQVFVQNKKKTHTQFYHLLYFAQMHNYTCTAKRI